MSEWIKCSERLPENGHPVITFSKSTQKYNMLIYGSGMFLNFRQDVTETYPQVTHWMPLPNPPEVNGE